MLSIINPVLLNLIVSTVREYGIAIATGNWFPFHDIYQPTPPCFQALWKPSEPQPSCHCYLLLYEDDVVSLRIKPFVKGGDVFLTVDSQQTNSSKDTRGDFNNS
jgi:hypothetical protein